MNLTPNGTSGATSGVTLEGQSGLIVSVVDNAGQVGQVGQVGAAVDIGQVDEFGVVTSFMIFGFILGPCFAAFVHFCLVKHCQGNYC